MLSVTFSEKPSPCIMEICSSHLKILKRLECAPLHLSPVFLWASCLHLHHRIPLQRSAVATGRLGGIRATCPAHRSTCCYALATTQTSWTAMMRWPSRCRSLHHWWSSIVGERRRRTTLETSRALQLATCSSVLLWSSTCLSSKAAMTKQFSEAA